MKREISVLIESPTVLSDETKSNLVKKIQDALERQEGVINRMVTAGFVEPNTLVKSDEFYKTLSPGIRKLVRQLNEWGFDTTDSGDGTNFEECMECAVSWPMIVIMIDREKKDPFEETDRLAKLLWDAGVKLGTDRVPEYPRTVQLTYSPLDRNCIVTVDNILDSDLK